MGFGLTYVYTHYYTDPSTADIYKYYTDAIEINQVAYQNPIHYLQLVLGINADAPYLQNYLTNTRNWQPHTAEWLNVIKATDYNFFNANRLVTRVNTVLLFFTGPNIWALVVWYCTISTWGLLLLYKALQPFVAGRLWLFKAVLFLTPSALFWQSAPMKEPLLLLGLGLFIYHFLALTKRFSWFTITVAAFSFWLIVLCKYYVAAALVLPCIGYGICTIKPKINPAYIYAWVLWGGVLAATASVYVSPQKNLFTILSNKRAEAVQSALYAEAKELMFTNRVEPHPVNYIKALPQTAHVAFLEPASLSKGALIAVSTLENSAILLLILYLLFTLKPPAANTPIVLFLAVYALVLLYIIAFTTPIAGGIVRYKTAAIPFLLVALVLAGNKNTQNHKLKHGAVV